MIPALLFLLSVPAAAAPDLQRALPAVRAERKDLDVRPDRWETRSTLPAVEAMLADPLSIPGTFDGWSASMKASTSSADLVLLAAETLGVHIDTAPLNWREDPFPPDAGLPPDFGREATRLAVAIEKAQPFLDRAVASVPADRRAVLVSSLSAILMNREGDRLDPKLFDDADKFDLTSLLQAAFLLARAADEAIPGLAAVPAASVGLRKLQLPVGQVLFAGASEESFDRDDLESSVLVVSLGEKSRYLGPVAAAKDGQIRLVIDLSRDVSVQAAAAPQAAGSGVFGIGLLYVPRAEGSKVLQAGDFSLGAGLFGVGGLFLNSGSYSTLAGGRFTQGAGAWGVGLFDVAADSAAVEAHLSAQGFGGTKGAGLFRLRGDGARVECGLVEPDPREDKATLSFCQGTALGPRALAAGGIGLALIDGDDSTLRSGYFAQGAGYWHGFGGLAVVGDGNRLKARRYDQGAGVHTAAGALTVEGDGNQLVNWGVGPGYGWDWGSGAFRLTGDENSVYAEWGAGHGDINGNGLVQIEGDQNRLSLPEFGSGAFRRNAPSYGLAVIDGAGNSMKGPLALGAVQFDPWGMLDAPGLVFDPALKFPKPDWPKVDAGEAAREQTAMLARRAEAAAAKPEPERYADWLSIASSFSLSGDTPRRALNRLFALPSERAGDLARLVSPDFFDEFLWLRAVLAGLGAPGADALAAEAAKASGTRRAVLTGLLRFGGAAAAPRLVESLSDPDWRVRREAAVALGWVFDRETGEEPGRLAFLAAASKAAGGKSFDGGGNQRAADAMSLLALDPGLRAEDRLAVLAKIPGPTDPLNAEAYAVLAGVLARSSDTYRDAVRKETGRLKAAQDSVRQALETAAADADAAVAHAAVVALGQLGDEQDAPLLEKALEHPSALVRDAAAAALGKLGKAGRDRLAALLGSRAPRTRALACLGLSLSPEWETLKLLELPFEDSDETVRRTAVAALSAVQSPLRGKRGAFVPALKRLAETDPSASVRAAARWQLQSIGN